MTPLTPGFRFASPLGDIVLRAEDDHLTGVFFAGQKYFPDFPVISEAREGSPLVRQAQEELLEYFAGQRTRFSVPLHLRGTTFQRQVWKALLAVPFGELSSYGAVAKQLGLPMSAARAVGGAVGHNPVSIIVPCHRIVGATGSMTGYAGGLDRKAALLEIESKIGSLFSLC
jgi:methylated-DNA-[protein]-cysteine S-methyltransferase